jgi:hypothetical protein
MTSLMRMALVGLAVSGFSLGLAQRSEAGGHKHRKYYEPVETFPVSVHLAFAPREVRVIREYYVPQYRSLPPGLQKKYDRTGQLPPGWQKKFQPFPVVVERQLYMLPAGYQRGIFDGHAVIFNPRSGMMVDVVAIF